MKLFQGGQQSTVESAPLPFMFSEGEYRLTRENKWIRVEATVGIRVYEKGWVEIPLFPTRALLSQATVRGKPLSVLARNGQHTVQLKGAGAHQFELLYYLPVSSESATRSFELLRPATSASRLRWVLPGSGLKVVASPSIPLAQKTLASKTVVTGVLPSGAEQVRLSWTPLKADPTLRGKLVQAQPKLYARLYQAVVPGEKELSLHLQVDYTILRNQAELFRLQLPEGVEVEQVDCPQMRDWDWGKNRQLRIHLESPVSGSHSLKLHLTKPLESIEGSWLVPAVKVLDVERIKGSVGLASDGGIEIEGARQKEARPIDVKELPRQVAALDPTPLLLAYEYHKQPYEIEVSSRKGKELPVLGATIDTATGVTLVTTDGKVCTSFNLQLRNARLQTLKLDMPEGATVWSSFVGQEPVKPRKDKDGSLRLPIRADGGAEPQEVRLVYVQEAPVGRLLGHQSFEVPRLEVPISVLNWTVYLPEGREVFKIGGNMRPGLTHLGTIIDGLEPDTIDEEKSEVAQVRREAKAPQARNKSGLFAQQRYQANERLDNRRMTQMIQEASRGSFPVDVQIPQTGQAFMFSKLLLVGDGPRISVRYYSNALAWLAGIGFFALVLVGFRGWTHERRGLLRIAALLALLVSVQSFWPLIGRLLNGAGLAGLILLGLGAYRLLASRKEKVDA